MLRILFLLTCFFVLWPRGLQAQDSELVGHPAIEAAAQRIREQNTVTIYKTIKETRTVYELRYCRRGLFGHRRQVIRVPRQIQTSRQVAETRVNLDDGMGWNNLGDPRLGIDTNVFPIDMLPAAAGARGTKINRAAASVLKDNGATDFGVLDRVLVRTPRSTPGLPGKRELVRIEAVVGGADDQRVVVTVKVQQRDAAGNFVSNKALLKARAQEIWNAIKSQLDKG